MPISTDYLWIKCRLLRGGDQYPKIRETASAGYTIKVGEPRTILQPLPFLLQPFYIIFPSAKKSFMKRRTMQCAYSLSDQRNVEGIITIALFMQRVSKVSLNVKGITSGSMILLYSVIKMVNCNITWFRKPFGSQMTDITVQWGNLEDGAKI